MIYLTFYHGRNVFKGGQFVTWIQRVLPTAKFEGFEYGEHYPTISISLKEFLEAKDQINARNLYRVRGEFTILETLVYGVNNFDNCIDDKVKDDDICIIA